jgi:Kef-type K+ transport system membrane component KefB
MVALLLFLPAGTMAYANGWLFLAVLFGPMLIAGFVMFFKSPDFLAKRLDAKEKQATQKGVLAFSGLMFLAGFVAIVWIVVEKFTCSVPITNQPLFYFGLTTIVLGVQLFLAGFLGELINRRSSDRNSYLIDEKLE